MRSARHGSPECKKKYCLAKGRSSQNRVAWHSNMKMKWNKELQVDDWNENSCRILRFCVCAQDLNRTQMDGFIHFPRRIFDTGDRKEWKKKPRPASADAKCVRNLIWEAKFALYAIVCNSAPVAILNEKPLGESQFRFPKIGTQRAAVPFECSKKSIWRKINI